MPTHHDTVQRRRDVTPPVVLAIDVGSTGARGGLYDGTGRPLSNGKHKTRHGFTLAADGTASIDPDRVVEEVDEIVTAAASAGVPIAAVAIDTFASSLVGVDRDGKAVTPCLTYADSRAADLVGVLRGELDAAAIHQRTGTHLHPSYLTAQLRWLKASEPDRFAVARHWMSIGEYAHLRLLGAAAAGMSTAAWTGMLDRHRGVWDAELVAAAGIDETQLSPIAVDVQFDEDRVVTRWPALRGATWLTPFADGYASNVGIGATDPATIALSASTSGAMRILVPGVPPSVPPGLWAYRVSNEATLVGGALNDVGRLVAWLDETLALDRRRDLDRAATLLADPGDETPLVLPFLTGERSTGWASEARAAFLGISPAATAAALYRGAMEGVALAYARIAEQLSIVAGPAHRVIASGGVSADLPEWLQIVADVLGAPVEMTAMKRPTLRGTAVLALEAIDPGGERAPATIGATHAPVPERSAYYADRRHRFEDAYARIVDR